MILTNEAVLALISIIFVILIMIHRVVYGRIEEARQNWMSEQSKFNALDDGREWKHPITLPDKYKGKPIADFLTTCTMEEYRQFIVDCVSTDYTEKRKWESEGYQHDLEVSSEAYETGYAWLRKNMFGMEDAEKPKRTLETSDGDTLSIIEEKPKRHE